MMVSGHPGFVFCLIWCLISSSFVCSVPLGLFNSTQVKSSSTENSLTETEISIERNKRTFLPILNNETSRGEKSFEIALKNPNGIFEEKLSPHGEGDSSIGLNGVPGVFPTSSNEPISENGSKTSVSTQNSHWENPTLILSNDERKEGGSEAEQNLSSPSTTNGGSFDLLGIFIPTLIINPPPPINETLEANETSDTPKQMLSTHQYQVDGNSKHLDENDHHNRNERDTDNVILSDKSHEFFITEENDLLSPDSTLSFDENEEMMTTEETMETSTDIRSSDEWDDSNPTHSLIRRSLTMGEGPRNSNGEDTSGPLGPSPATLHHEASGETKGMGSQPYTRFISQIGEDKALAPQSTDLLLRPTTDGGDEIPNPFTTTLLHFQPMLRPYSSASNNTSALNSQSQMSPDSYDDELKTPNSSINSDEPKRQIPNLFLFLISPENKHTFDTLYPRSHTAKRKVGDIISKSSEDDGGDVQKILSRTKRDTQTMTTIYTPDFAETTPLSSPSDLPAIPVNTKKCTMSNNTSIEIFSNNSTSLGAGSNATLDGNTTSQETVQTYQVSDLSTTPSTIIYSTGDVVYNTVNSNHTAKTMDALNMQSNNASTSDKGTNTSTTSNALTNATNFDIDRLTSLENLTGVENFTPSDLTVSNSTGNTSDRSSPSLNSTFNTGVANSTTNAEPLNQNYTNNNGVSNSTTSAEPLSQNSTNDNGNANFTTNAEPLSQNSTNNNGVSNSTTSAEPLSQNSTNNNGVANSTTSAEPLSQNSTNNNGNANSTKNAEPLNQNSTNNNGVANSTTNATNVGLLTQNATTNTEELDSTINATNVGSLSQNSTTNTGGTNSSNSLTQSQGSITTGPVNASSTSNSTSAWPENIVSSPTDRNLLDFRDNATFESNVSNIMGNILSIRSPENIATNDTLTTSCNTTLGSSNSSTSNASSLASTNAPTGTILVTNKNLSSTSAASNSGQNPSLLSNVTTNLTNANVTTNEIGNSSNMTTSSSNNTNISSFSDTTINSVNNSSTTSNIAIGNGASIGNSGSITANNGINTDPIVTSSNSANLGIWSPDNNLSSPSFNSTIVSSDNSTKVSDETLGLLSSTSENGNNSSSPFIPIPNLSSSNSSNKTSAVANSAFTTKTAFTTNTIFAPLTSSNATISEIKNSSFNSTGILNTSEDAFQSPSIPITPSNAKVNVLGSSGSSNELSIPDSISNQNHSEGEDGGDGNVEIAYTVSEAPAHLFYAFQETVKGNASAGSYRVLLPDGRTEIVNYTADDSGYHPVIEYVNSGIQTNGTAA